MIVCDGQHDELTEGLHNLTMKGETEVDGDKVIFNLHVNVVGKQFCQQHFVENVLAKIDFAALASAAKQS